jgi:hypothetical protein
MSIIRWRVSLVLDCFDGWTCKLPPGEIASCSGSQHLGRNSRSGLRQLLTRMLV